MEQFMFIYGMGMTAVAILLMLVILRFHALNLRQAYVVKAVREALPEIRRCANGWLASDPEALDRLGDAWLKYVEAGGPIA